MQQSPDIWVFIRGLARESRHWLGFLERAQICLDRPCIALDIPGVGEKFGDNAPSSIAAMRQALQDTVELKGVNKIGLVALSMGGMIALDWLQSEPEKISHLVLINSSSRLNPFWQRLRPKGIGLLIQALCSVSVKRREAKVLACVINRKDLFARTLQSWLDIQCDHPVSKANIITMLIAAARYKVPVLGADQSGPKMLFLASAQDRLVNSQCSQSLADYFDAPIFFETQVAGHDLPLDNPDWLLKQLEAFLRHG